jgi:ureidoglycolate dehydrogenase (NAD+)
MKSHSLPLADVVVTHDALRDFCTTLLRVSGLRPDDAALVADSLVEANLRGIDSHGVARLPHYLRRLATGSINSRPMMDFVKLGPAAGRLDGDHGLGQLVMQRATQEAIALAKGAGAAWVSVCNSSHCGALDYYGLQIARTGMIGFAFTHVDPMVLPHGALQPFCGTNPICITAPSEQEQVFCLDMATSIVPWNQVTNATMEGKPIPPGLAVDASGNGTTDPSDVTALYPFGGYKGSGLGLAIDILCAMLGGAPYGPDIPKMYGDLTQRRRLGGLVGAIDIARFMPLNQVQARVSELLVRWGSLPPVEPGGRVIYPGEPEELSKQLRLRDGILLPATLADEFDKLAHAGGLPVFSQALGTTD